MEPDGSGVVAVDVVLSEGVLDLAPDLPPLIRVDDLVDAGWEVSVPTSPGPDGTLTVHAERPFDSPDQLIDVLQGIDGPQGMFRDSSLRVQRDGATVTYTLRVELTDPPSTLDLVNPAIAEAMGGEPFGIPLSELEARAGGPLDEAVEVVVEASIPGGDGRVGPFTLASAAPGDLEVVGSVVDEAIAAADLEAERARAEVPRSVRQLLIWWGCLFAFVIVVVVVVIVRRR